MVSETGAFLLDGGLPTSFQEKNKRFDTSWNVIAADRYSPEARRTTELADGTRL